MSSNEADKHEEVTHTVVGWSAVQCESLKLSGQSPFCQCPSKNPVFSFLFGHG